jgi:hypothetical protein
MQQSIFRWLVVSVAMAAILVTAGLVWQSDACAGDRARHGASDVLFRNYYVPPGHGCVGAELYLCPLPTPPLVGHTYITYPPLMPHEFLYPHCRTYLRYTPGAGYTKARVIWY